MPPSIAACTACQAVGEPVGRRRQAQRLGGQAADAFAIHRELRGARGRDHGRHAGLGDLDQDVGGDGLDLGHDDVRPFLLDQALQRGGVGHRDHVGAMRDLVARRVGVAVDGDGLHAEALQRDDDFLAEFAAAQQHDARRGRREGCADVHEGVAGIRADEGTACAGNSWRQPADERHGVNLPADGCCSAIL